MPAIFHSSSILNVKAAVPSTEHISLFLIQNVPPLLALKMLIMFSSCCHKAGPYLLTTTKWTFDLHWSKWNLSLRNQMCRAQVIACHGAGLRDSGKNNHGRGNWCMERNVKHEGQEERQWSPGKGRDVGSDFSSWFLSRACFYLQP